jgi:peptidoglycan/LPS O-acetylase OafA/YrhL
MAGARERVVRVGLWAGLPLVLAMQGMHSLAFSSTRHVRDALHDSAMALFFTWLVAGAAVGFRGAAGAALSWRPLLYVGTISYGVYVYHNYLWFIPHERINAALVGWFGGGPGALAWMNRWFAGEGLGLFLPRIAVTIAVAALSWKVFEKPLNDLKRHFEYDKPVKKAEVTRPALAAS